MLSVNVRVTEAFSDRLAVDISLLKQVSVEPHNGGCVMVRVLARETKGRGFDSRPFHFQVTTLGKLFTHMCLCHQAVQFGTGQGAVMPCGWEGNRRSGVALAMRH